MKVPADGAVTTAGGGDCGGGATTLGGLRVG
jgi:hypothetical protein